MKGYIQVYTGNGKGKTTAAFGLALRAAGAGLKVYIAQFALFTENLRRKIFKPRRKVSKRSGRSCVPESIR
jgi:cob(I)alamin adenosyltransferase